MSTVHGSFGLGMVGALDVSSAPDARLLEEKDNEHSGLLARVRGSPYPRAMRARRSSRVGEGNQDHSECVYCVRILWSGHGRRIRCVVLS
eukprot:6189933-Pleurochrysis_carterae.AAC.1